MAVQKIDKQHWRAFFDWLSHGLLGARAEIEVASLDLGDQIEAEWLPLLGITYDYWVSPMITKMMFSRLLSMDLTI